MSRGATVAGWIGIILVLALCVEAMSYAALRLVPSLAYFAYRAPVVDASEFDAYLKDRHPVLGWPGAGWLAANADARGARKSPANAAIGGGPPCVSLYGDSFAYADEVDDAAAWANVMADVLGCRVDNYGVGGFGTDQALLRFEGHLAEGRDLGDTVILTMLPDNLNRNVNQWRYLMGSPPLSFKPAFHVAPAGIALAPLFSGDLAGLRAIAADPAGRLAAETYAPGHPGLRRPKVLGFPFTATLAAILLDQARSYRGGAPAGRRFLSNQPVYFDTPEGPSEAKLAVAGHIIDRFRANCAEQDKTCVFLLIPDPELVYQAERDGAHGLDTWLRGATQGLHYIDATGMFAGLDDICAHMTNPDRCNGHYNADGYARLAAFVLERIGPMNGAELDAGR